MVAYSQSYYDEIRGKLHAVLFVVADQLPRMTVDFVAEELDANEIGLALETIVEGLAATSAPVPRHIVDDLAELADRMQMDYGVRERLTR